MTDAKIRDALISILSDVTGLERETVENVEYLKDLATWDSLSLVEFIYGTDEIFGLDIQPKELRGCTTVDDLMRTIRVLQAQAGAS
jgi:acyl carrier protein